MPSGKGTYGSKVGRPKNPKPAPKSPTTNKRKKRK